MNRCFRWCALIVLARSLGPGIRKARSILSLSLILLAGLASFAELDPCWLAFSCEASLDEVEKLLFGDAEKRGFEALAIYLAIDFHPAVKSICADVLQQVWAFREGPLLAIFR